MTPEIWEERLRAYLSENTPCFVSDLLCHSAVVLEEPDFVLICPEHFTMILSDSKRQKKAFEIIKTCFPEAQNFIIRFDNIVAQFSPYALEQQRLSLEHEGLQNRLRQSPVAQILEQHSSCELLPLTQTSSHW